MGGGSTLAAPAGMNETDSIHSSGKRLTTVSPARSPFTTTGAKRGFTGQLACRDTRMRSHVTAKIKPNSIKATAEAAPKFHHLKPSSYMK